MLKSCIDSYLKAWVKLQTIFTHTISKSEMGNCTSWARTNPHKTFNGGMLKVVSEIRYILGTISIHKLGFLVSKNKATARQATMLNRGEEELPSTSDIAKMDDIELQEIMENVAKSTENLIVQLKGESSKDLPMHKLLGLDKQLRSI